MARRALLHYLPIDETGQRPYVHVLSPPSTTYGGLAALDIALT